MKNLPVAVLAIALLLAGCGKTVVVPHTNRPGDNYCVYTIAQVSGAGGTMKVNDKICIYCTPGGPSRCPTHSRSVEAGGVTYTLSNSSNICTTCPNTNTYEVK